MRPDHQRPLTAAEQFGQLRASPICSGEGSLRAGRLVWLLHARLTPLSRLYMLRIEYQQGDAPDVSVVDPDLVDLAGGRRLPHVYEQRPTRLCLYLPQTEEWNAAMRLDQTVVPWALLWLFFFEEWLASDEWKGGGEHPLVKTRRRR